MHRFRLYAFHRLNPRCTGINPDGAIFVEYPVENVVVVANGAHPANHQLAPLGTDVRLTHLLVFIFRSCVAFKNGDGAGDLHRRTGIIGNGFIEHHGVGRHVFAAHQRRGQGAHAVIAGIQIGFEVPAHVRVTVRDDHPAQGALICISGSFVIVELYIMP